MSEQTKHSPIPLPEMISDCEATQRDLERLDAIIFNLELFIRDSGEEDRTGFRMDLFKYQSLRSQAFILVVKITAKIDEREALLASIEGEAK